MTKIMSKLQLREALVSDYSYKVALQVAKCMVAMDKLSEESRCDPQAVAELIRHECEGKGLEILHEHTSAILTYSDLKGSDVAAIAEKNLYMAVYMAVTSQMTFISDEIAKRVIDYADEIDWHNQD